MSQIKRFFHPANKSYFLFGPRGTGKSTLMKRIYPDAKLFDLLDPELERQLRAQPSRLKEWVLAHASMKTFIIDEVQKVPELLNIVHQLIEEKRGWQFILVGSSARKLRRTGVDLLAGRAQLKHLHPFMAAELKEQFDLKTQLQLGMLPLVLDSEDPENDLKAYIALYMREEVTAEGLIRKIDSFSRFLEVVSLSQASVINYSSIARDCLISNKSVENYVQILEDLLLSFRLPIFTKKAKRTMTHNPKFYFFDVGVFKSIRPTGPLDDLSSLNGQAIETLVAQHLRAWIDYSSKSGQLYYWRTRSGLEVDFIIYGEIGFYAIEVKSSHSVHSKDSRGLREFSKDYPSCTCIVLYGGKEKQMVNNLLYMPIEEFLVNLSPDQDLK